MAGENNGLLQNISVSGIISCPFGSNVGGLVGGNGGQIAIVTSSVDIGGAQNLHYAGGIAGTNTGTIRNTSSSGSLFSGVPAGGLVGSTTGVIQDSHATGRVSSVNSVYVGGLAGDASGTILRCFATGDVTGKQEVGGLVGYGAYLKIDSSFATGTATSLHYAGNLVGGGNTVTIVNSYARGAATGTNAQTGYDGGLVGWFSSYGGTITTAYSTGAPSGGRYAGGSVGYVTSSISMAQTYWDLDTSGVSNPASGVGNKANYPALPALAMRS